MEMGYETENKELAINIDWFVVTGEDLELIVGIAEAIQKKYSCNCTLNVSNNSR